MWLEFGIRGQSAPHPQHQPHLTRCAGGAGAQLPGAVAVGARALRGAVGTCRPAEDGTGSDEWNRADVKGAM